ncbi:MAG: DUF2273 domain-containing protein [Peptococcaceae bacterium]|nr:DUF2273 domain-containing protein [Peptococcaceae bacterium]
MYPWWLEFLEQHSGKIGGIVVGLIFGWFAITYGFWKALFVFLSAVIGYFIGRRIDEQVDWSKLWNKLISKHR